MKRERITRHLLSSALRRLRTSRGLTQKEVAQRAAAYQDRGLGRLLESQISDFERGRALPSLGSLLNLLAACSDSGSQVDFTRLQRALESVDADDGEPPPRPPESAVDEAAAAVEKLISALSERMVDRLRGEIEEQKGEMAALRSRVGRTERLLASLVEPDGVLSP